MRRDPSAEWYGEAFPGASYSLPLSGDEALLDVFAAALLGPAVHFTHYLVSVYGYGQFVNPASTATEGVLVSVALLTAATAFRRYRARTALVVGAR